MTVRRSRSEEERSYNLLSYIKKKQCDDGQEQAHCEEEMKDIDSTVGEPRSHLFPLQTEIPDHITHPHKPSQRTQKQSEVVHVMHAHTSISILYIFRLLLLLFTEFVYHILGPCLLLLFFYALTFWRTSSSVNVHNSS